MLLSTAILYFTLALCAIGLSAVVYRYDLYRHESKWMLLWATVLGGIFMLVAGEAQVLVIRAVTDRGSLITNNWLALLAGSTEEIAKLAVPLLLSRIAWVHMDEPLDGLLYGAFAGLGAALAESIVVLGWNFGTPFLPAQEPIRLAGHLVMGGISGAGVGLLVMGSRFAWGGVFTALLAATALHTAWDVVAFDAADYYASTGRLKTWHTATPAVLMIIGFIFFRWWVAIASKLTRAHLGVCDVETKRCPPY